jgi:hypothetical protein
MSLKYFTVMVHLFHILLKRFSFFLKTEGKVNFLIFAKSPAKILAKSFAYFLNTLPYSGPLNIYLPPFPPSPPPKEKKSSYSPARWERVRT